MAKNFKKERVAKEFFEELIDLARVTRVVKWWRRMRFRATVVIWDKKWRVWLWVWKSWEVATAIKKAVSDAKKKMINFPIINWTIAHPIKLKFKWAKILMMPAGPGTWIISWGSTRKIADLLWIENILTKRFWSTNKLVNAQITMKALAILADRTDKSKHKEIKEEEINKEAEEKNIEKKAEKKAPAKKEKKAPAKKAVKKPSKK